MPIRLRFILVANILLAGLGMIGYIAIRDVQNASDVFSQAARDSIDQVKLSDRIRANLPDLRASELEYIMTTDPHQQPAVLQKMELRREALRQVMDHYEYAQTRAPQTDCLSCHQVFGRYSRSHTRITELVAAGENEAALAIYQDSAAEYEELLAEADAFRQDQYAAARAYSLEGSASAEEARNILVACFAAAAVLTFIVGHTMSGYVHRRLQRLREGTRRVMGGNLGEPIEIRGGDEFGQLAGAFNAMTESLRKSHAENSRLHEAAIRMREERINLLSDGLKRAVEAQENERQRVARELHDGIGQALTALQLGLGRLEMNTRSPAVKEAAASLRELSVCTLGDIRDLARDLRPGVLDEMGLEPALRNYVEQFSERTGVPVTLRVTGLDGRLPPEIEVTVFRIVQEGLANVARHAKATRAGVSVERSGAALRVTVEDNGAGFNVEAVRANRHRSLGLSGMEERCRFTDGALAIESGPGRGTRLVCTWRAPLAGPGNTRGRDGNEDAGRRVAASTPGGLS